MDMSVPVAPEKRAVPDEAKTAAQPRNRPNSSELDVWLEKAEAMGELKRITAEVSPDLEGGTQAHGGVQDRDSDCPFIARCRARCSQNIRSSRACAIHDD